MSIRNNLNKYFTRLRGCFDYSYTFLGTFLGPAWGFKMLKFLILIFKFYAMHLNHLRLSL
jgi:hypothetical protein